MNIFQLVFDTYETAQKCCWNDKVMYMYMTCFGIAAYINDNIINKKWREKNSVWW